MTVPSSIETEAVVPTDVAPVVDAGPPPVEAAAEAVLSGRISYVDADGEVRPDAGARILIVPEERSGSSRLAPEGFRAGADDADRSLAVASIRAVGGDFVTADADGNYAAMLPAAGLYQVLIVSRYQPRAEGSAPDAAAMQVLAGYFDRPAQVIGESALHASPFRYRGSGASTRDQTFERP
ncbi:MAG: hypothetical protein KDA75_08020, partial [Planctomycetaceae bacterium]|nr:hypothetical protein [Planctomycetaceae bacterium]